MEWGKERVYSAITNPEIEDLYEPTAVADLQAAGGEDDDDDEGGDNEEPKEPQKPAAAAAAKKKGSPAAPGKRSSEGGGGGEPATKIPQAGGAPESNAAKALAKLIQQVDPTGAVACVDDDDELDVTR